MRRRVLFVAGINSTLEHFVRPLALRLKDEGVETVAAVGGPCGEMGFDHVHCLPEFRRRGPGQVLRALRELRRVVEDEDPALLHLHTPASLVLGRIVGRAAGVPSVAVVHGTFLEPLGPRSIFYATVEASIARFSVVTVTVNSEDARFYGSVTNPASVYVAPAGGMGLDSARLREAALEPIRLAAPPSIIVVGRLTSEKNLDLIVDGFTRLRANRPGATLNFVGSALPGDKPWRVPNMDGISAHGWVRNPYPLIAGADLLVTASRREGFSMVVAEALVLGVPVAAVTNRGIRQISAMVGSRAPLVVSDARSDALGEAMARALDGSDSLLPSTAVEAWSSKSVVDFHARLVLKHLNRVRTTPDPFDVVVSTEHKGTS